MSVIIKRNDTALGDKEKVIRKTYEPAPKVSKKGMTVNLTHPWNRPTLLPVFNEIYTPTTRFDERKGISQEPITEPYVISPIPYTGETNYNHKFK